MVKTNCSHKATNLGYRADVQKFANEDFLEFVEQLQREGGVMKQYHIADWNFPYFWHVSFLKARSNKQH